MKNALLFGAAYYPEYMPRDRIHEDLTMMKNAGMNAVRIAESTWSVLEPRAGVFDFSYIDAVLNEAENLDMQIIVGTPAYAIPARLAALDPDVMVTDKRGTAMYGMRQLINLWNPTFREAAENVIRALVSRVAQRPCVIGFQIDNETKHYDNFGAQIQRAFKEYLKNKFETTQALNRAFYLNYWSNSIASWDDFPDMRGCINGGLAAEYEKFLRRSAAEYLGWQVDIVNEYKRDDQFVTHNMDYEWKPVASDLAQAGYSYGVQPGINHYETSKYLTLIGTDIYHPTQDALTGAEIASGGDEMRSLLKSNYLNLEAQAQGCKSWTPYPGQLRLHAYSHLASGSMGLLYWNWHSIHNGLEAYWRGVLSHDLEPNAVYEEVRLIGAEWGRIGADALTVLKRNKIAVVVDNNSLTGLKFFPVDKNLTYNDIFRWMYDSLYEMNLECDIVDVNALEPDEYAMIVTPALYSASEETTKKLERFVKNGGVLISSFRSFAADEYLSVYPDAQPHILRECFGASYNQFTDPGSARLKGRPVKYYAELLKTDTAQSLGDYEHKYWGKYAGITRNRFGKGAAYYIGCFTEKQTLKEIYAAACADAGIKRELAEISWPVIIRGGLNRKGEEIRYILHYCAEPRELSCPYGGARDILTGKEYRKGDPIFLKDWDALVLSLNNERDS